MKLIEALTILREPAPDHGAPLHAYLACGFTPLHLETLLAAELRKGAPERPVELTTGLFGDLLGNLDRASASDADVAVVVLEWGDVDPRLGLRSLGGWRVDDLAHVLSSAAERVERLAEVLGRLSKTRTVVCCLPTLPLPPLFPSAVEQTGAEEAALRALLASLATALAGEQGIRLLSSQSVDEHSPPAARLDVGSELAAGFPYTTAHAAALAELLAGLVLRPQPKKGLITDLDDTLWDGLLGEIGAEAVGWSLEADAQAHGLYQQLLASLASAGVLLAVASKNEPALVDEAFAREDLLLPRDAVFPFEVGWGSKAASVGRILAAWNIAPDAVVFVDDSPMEVAEVQAAFPAMECLVFPRGEKAELWRFLRRLRSAFGKSTVTEEDVLRLASIRSSQAIREREPLDSTGYSDDFLSSAGGSVTIDARKAHDARALELVNKTNQFNLNGRRLDESSFRRRLEDPDSFLVTASYSDRFGPLGKIASILGTRNGSTLVVTGWVMSCRAFSRRIEYHCLAYLFDAFGVEKIVFDYDETPRNAVFQDFLASIDAESEGERPELTRETFLQRAPALVHEVVEVDG
jgi:FkbH-like protein